MHIAPDSTAGGSRGEEGVRTSPSRAIPASGARAFHAISKRFLFSPHPCWYGSPMQPTLNPSNSRSRAAHPSCPACPAWCTTPKAIPRPKGQAAGCGAPFHRPLDPKWLDALQTEGGAWLSHCSPDGGMPKPINAQPGPQWSVAVHCSAVQH